MAEVHAGEIEIGARSTICCCGEHAREVGADGRVPHGGDGNVWPRLESGTHIAAAHGVRVRPLAGVPQSAPSLAGVGHRDRI
jgi:hypothetical protein